MVLNDALPRIEVAPETYKVRADGDLLGCEGAPRSPPSWWRRAASRAPAAPRRPSCPDPRRPYRFFSAS